MILAVVKGTIISTNKTEKLRGSKLLVVEEWNIDTQSTSHRPLVALDIVGAGAGELVLCVSGSSARQTEETAQRPVDLVIIGIVDQAEMNGETRYQKYGAHSEEPVGLESALPAKDDPSVDAGLKQEAGTPEAVITEVPAEAKEQVNVRKRISKRKSHRASPQKKAR